jgi:hypothetical protein
MGTRIIRSLAYLAAATLLLVIGAALMANFNVQTAQAGGSPQPLYVLISTKMAANAHFTIHTTTQIGGLNSYLVHSTSTGVDYNVAWLGTDFICIHKAGMAAARMLCLPYSSISGINF